VICSIPIAFPKGFKVFEHPQHRLTFEFSEQRMATKPPAFLSTEWPRTNVST
jgi:hypothetical protein